MHIKKNIVAQKSLKTIRGNILSGGLGRQYIFILSSREQNICGHSIEKPIEMPYWNLLCLQRICLFVYFCSVTENKITKPHAKKFDGLLVNDDEIVS